LVRVRLVFSWRCIALDLWFFSAYLSLLLVSLSLLLLSLSFSLSLSLLSKSFPWTSVVLLPTGLYINTICCPAVCCEMTNSWNAVDLGDGGQLGVSLWGSITASLAGNADMRTGKCWQGVLHLPEIKY
jgi:hypothetical protein